MDFNHHLTKEYVCLQENRNQQKLLSQDRFL